MSTSRSLLSRLSLLVAGAVVAGSLLGCSQGATRDADSQEITEAGTADAFALQIGDCFNDTTEEELVEVPAVPCSEPHDNEVYYLFDLPEGEFPGDEAVLAAAEEGCLAQFDAFVGMAYEDSELDWFPLSPTEAGWTAIGDREIVCSVWDPAGQTEGSLKGVAR